MVHVCIRMIEYRFHLLSQMLLHHIFLSQPIFNFSFPLFIFYFIGSKDEIDSILLLLGRDCLTRN